MIAGEAYDVARHFAGRIETPVFVLVVNTFDLQGRDALGDFRRHLLREEDEIVADLELLRERRRRRLERRARVARASPASRRPGRETPRSISPAWRSRAARRRDRRRGRGAPAPRFRGCSESSPAPAGTHCRSTAGIASGRPARRTAAAGSPNTIGARNRGNSGAGAARFCAVDRPVIAAPRPVRPRCGAVPGCCIFSCSRAIFSTRTGMAHVDCSSCSWPNSVS